MNNINNPHDTIITNCSDCIMLPSIIDSEIPKININTTDIITSEILSSITDILSQQYPGVWRVCAPKRNLVPLKRLCSSHCNICDREHDNQGAYICLLGGQLKMFCFQNKSHINKKYICL